MIAAMIFNSPPQFTAAPAHDEVIVAEFVGFGGIGLKGLLIALRTGKL